MGPLTSVFSRSARIGLGWARPRHLLLVLITSTRKRVTHMTTGQAPEAARRLTAFIGQWKVVGALREGDSEAVIVGEWRFEPAMDGWGVRGVLQTDIEGLGGPMEEFELIGFDAPAGNVHMFSANRYAIRDHVGGWTADDRLKVRYQGKVGARVVTEEITLNLDGRGRMVADIVEQVDGEVVLTTTLELTKVGA